MCQEWGEQVAALSTERGGDSKGSNGIEELPRVDGTGFAHGASGARGVIHGDIHGSGKSTHHFGFESVAKLRGGDGGDDGKEMARGGGNGVGRLGGLLSAASGDCDGEMGLSLDPDVKGKIVADLEEKQEKMQLDISSQVATQTYSSTGTDNTSQSSKMLDIHARPAPISRAVDINPPVSAVDTSLLKSSKPTPVSSAHASPPFEQPIAATDVNGDGGVAEGEDILA